MIVEVSSRYLSVTFWYPIYRRGELEVRTGTLMIVEVS